MEDRRNKYTLPNEIWSHILSFVEDLHSIIAAKRVNKLFYNYMKPRSTLKSIKDIIWDDDVINLFVSRKEPIRLSEKQICEKLKQEVAYKVTIAGAEGSGKTLLRASMVGIGTEGTTPITLLFRSSNGFLNKMNMWEWWEEKVGHHFDQYRPRPSQFFSGSKAIVLLFALDNRSHFKELVEKWLKMIYIISERLNVEAVEFFLVGTKLDLGKREVSLHEAKMLAHELKMHYYEIDINNQQHREELKNAINHAALENIIHHEALEKEKSNGGFRLDATNAGQANKNDTNSQDSKSRCVVC